MCTCPCSPFFGESGPVISQLEGRTDHWREGGLPMETCCWGPLFSYALSRCFWPMHVYFPGTHWVLCYCSHFLRWQIDSMYLSSFCSLLFFPRLKMPSSSMSEYSHQVWMPSWKPWRIWPASPGMLPLLRSSSTWMASHSSLRWWKAAQSKCTQPWCLPPSTRKLWGPLHSLFRQCLSCYPRSTLELWCLLSSLFWKFPDVKTRPWPGSVKCGWNTAAGRGFVTPKPVSSTCQLHGVTWSESLNTSVFRVQRKNLRLLPQKA